MRFHNTTILFAALLSIGAANDVEQHVVGHRHLQNPFPEIFGYQTTSPVMDHLRLDLDQAALKELLTNGDMDGAYKVYQEGGYSKPYAIVHVDPPLDAMIDKGLKLEVITDDGTKILGHAKEVAPLGSDTVLFLYDNAPNCRVGGLSQDVSLTGCLPAGGMLQVAYRNQMSYMYDFETENLNDRTLQSLSTKAERKFHDCDACPYDFYERYNQYFGSFAYGNEFAAAAARAGATLGLTNGNMDFGPYEDDVGRAEILKKTSTYMNVWMYVIGEMELALDTCEKNCDACTAQDALYAWDKAVAYYTGSKDMDGRGNGVMLFAVADKHCQIFKTCSEDQNMVDGTSKVNIQIFRHFKAGQNDLNLGDCRAARQQKEVIERLMIVPLVQGTLKYSWINDYQGDTTAGDKENAEGAIYAATILPLLHKCNKADAKFVYDSTKANSPFFPAFIGVKERLERNYQCMGITCDQVGGFYDETKQEYLLNAKPCGGGGVNRTAAIVGVALGAVIAILVIIICRIKSKGTGKDTSYVPRIEVVDHSTTTTTGSPKSGPPSSIFDSPPPPIEGEDNGADSTPVAAPIVGAEDEVAQNDASDKELPPIS